MTDTSAALIAVSKIFNERERTAWRERLDATTANDAQYYAGYADAMHEAWQIVIDELRNHLESRGGDADC